ncbi:hypothetical protein L1987_26013 [Smallanthus sonchifolius]|uniref:Uncharacterized protein n=1 Tax=Smallanthus sonchifolius TaxID=185202 RepID=A0ACB9IAC9_9ASTR|nr:hypothetical protein L1987_26013 [Smallanthus sonchifolius]
MLLHIILSLFTLSLGTLQGSTSRATNNIAKPNCPTHCGNVTVPYPFGIGKETGCSLDDSFYVTCNTSDEGTKLFLLSTMIEIYNFSDSEFRIVAGIANRCYNQDGTIEEYYGWWLQLNTFTYSQKNTLTVLGCDDYSLIRGTKGRNFSIGCLGRRLFKKKTKINSSRPRVLWGWSRVYLWKAITIEYFSKKELMEAGAREGMRPYGMHSTPPPTSKLGREG